MNKKKYMEHILRHLAFIAQSFDIKSKITSITPYGTGIINKTYLIKTQDNKKYILQKVANTMGDIDVLMTNIQNVADFLSKKDVCTLNLVKTTQNNPYLCVDERRYRMYQFIDGQILKRLDFFEAKRAGCSIAKFSRALSDFPADTLVPTIKDFHNTAKIYDNFIQKINTCNTPRKNIAKPWIDYLISQNHYVDKINHLIAQGLPTRVIHGDTRLNNLIFADEDVCLIDFDTIMQGKLCYDFGDAVRDICNTVDMDAPKENVGFDTNCYIGLASGFLSVWNNLSPLELASLFVSPMLVTYELSLRFLTDYLDDDKYFGTSYSDQNLDRCKNQIALLQKMQQHQTLMQQYFATNIQNQAKKDEFFEFCK